MNFTVKKQQTNPSKQKKSRKTTIYRSSANSVQEYELELTFSHDKTSKYFANVWRKLVSNLELYIGFYKSNLGFVTWYYSPKYLCYLNASIIILLHTLKVGIYCFLKSRTGANYIVWNFILNAPKISNWSWTFSKRPGKICLKTLNVGGSHLQSLVRQIDFALTT